MNDRSGRVSGEQGEDLGQHLLKVVRRVRGQVDVTIFDDWRQTVEALATPRGEEDQDPTAVVGINPTVDQVG